MQRRLLLFVAVALGACFSEPDAMGPATSAGSTSRGPETTSSSMSAPTGPDPTATSQGSSSTGSGSSGRTSSGVTSVGEAEDATDVTTGGSTSTGARPTNRVVLFYGPDVAGDLAVQGKGNARLFVDQACVVQRDEFGLDCQTTHAVISVSNTDTIGLMDQTYGMPFGLPVEGPEVGSTIAAGFGLMIAEEPALDMTLSAAGVRGLNPATTWWSGAGDLGGLGSTCGDWESLMEQGAVGNATLVDGSWLVDFDEDCAIPRPILCVCW